MKKKSLLLTALVLISSARPMIAQEVNVVQGGRADLKAAINANPERESLPLLAQQGSKWSIVVKNGIAGMPESMMEKKTFQYLAKELVVINSIEYLRVIPEEQKIGTNDLSPILLREDREGGKVFRANIDGNERLMFDYNLKVGDSMQTYCGLESNSDDISFKFIIAGVEEKEIAAYKRRVYTIEGYVKDESAPNGWGSMRSYLWIEGIGDSEGFDIYPPGVTGGIPSELICFEDASGNSYVKYPALGCIITQTSAEQMFDDPSYSVYYNNGKLKIRCSSMEEKHQLCLYAVNGDLIAKKRFHGTEFTIDIAPSLVHTNRMIIVEIDRLFTQKIELK